MLSSGLLGIACMPLQAVERLTPTSTATMTATATATSTATSTNTPTATDVPTATPEPTHVSEVLPAVQPPVSMPIRGGTSLPMPEGTTVVWGGCASDGQCHWYNFYWAPTREAVLQNGESQVKVQHELCHAHQHWTISGGASLNPTNYDLHTWYDTAEGQSFVAAVSGLDWPWNHSAQNALEDFAWTCAYWYLDPGYLLDVSPARYDWAAQNLP
jgi:hypothetical protein